MNKGKNETKKFPPNFEKDCYSYFTYRFPNVNIPFQNLKLRLSPKLEFFALKCVKIQFSLFKIEKKKSIKIGIIQDWNLTISD